MFSPDAIVAATARLDPESRALVELSARRGMGDDEIADMLGIDADEVSRRHDEALAALAGELGDPHARRDDLRDELLRVDEATWRGEAEPRRAGSARTPARSPTQEGAGGASAAGAATPRPGRRLDVGDVPRTAARREAAARRGAAAGAGAAAPRPDESAGPDRADAAAGPARSGADAGTGPTRSPVLERVDHGRRPLARILVAIVAAVVAIALVVVLVQGGDDDGGSTQPSSASDVGSKSGTTGTETTPASSPSNGPAPSTMQRLNGTYGHGTAQLVPKGDGAELRMDATGFLRPRGGGYAVWLVRSTTDARRVYATADTTIRRSFDLPADWKTYKYVEVARAIPDLDSDYSGLVLLRVPVSDLAGG